MVASTMLVPAAPLLLILAAGLARAQAATTKQPTITSKDGNVLFDSPGGFCFGVAVTFPRLPLRHKCRRQETCATRQLV